MAGLGICPGHASVRPAESRGCRLANLAQNFGAVVEEFHCAGLEPWEFFAGVPLVAYFPCPLVNVIHGIRGCAAVTFDKALLRRQGVPDGGLPLRLVFGSPEERKVFLKPIVHHFDCHLPVLHDCDSNQIGVRHDGPHILRVLDLVKVVRRHPHRRRR